MSSLCFYLYLNFCFFSSDFIKHCCWFGSLLPLTRLLSPGLSRSGCCTLLLSLCFHTGRTVRGREEVWCREVEGRWQRQRVCMRSLCPHVLHITQVYAVSFHWSWESFQNNENLIVFLLLAKSQISLIVQGFNKGNSCFSFYLASVRDWTRSLRAGVAEVNVEHR